MKRENLSRYVWLSILAAVLTIALKAAAYYFTGSIGLLSDALESVINLVAALIALLLIKIAAQPPDDDHAFGHDKAEYFSSGIEGVLIFFAAFGIFYSAVPRLFAPQSLEHIGIGLSITLVATLINLIVGLILIRAGRQHHSIVLEADGRHLLTDVWTSVGVVLGIVIVGLTGWFVLDPIIALLVALNILWTGFQLIRRSALGLMDTAVSPETQGKIEEILDGYIKEKKIDYHALRTRQSGARKFISVHILVPDDWTVQKGHDLTEEIEDEIRQAVPESTVFTHLEPLEDPSSFYDLDLFRRK
ncbi:cation diffusion facilitator family transporter [soil metagenome]|jgi:cation diffusion facilitator family transporter|nr:cation diffusion facilitator family transporter [Pyrinomonadaceae bacterium]